jgi:hypothetical protein
VARGWRKASAIGQFRDWQYGFALQFDEDDFVGLVDFMVFHSINMTYFRIFVQIGAMNDDRMKSIFRRVGL